ncbi:MAG TPA: hypothetical protein VG500_03930 [Gemmatimonadales bacterium]|jgi:hypothetical protein|nr:hypothetical protein [Gemmatimonadales bacterium]
MRVPQYAKLSLAALALIALAACGGDSTAPDAPFDPDGTSTDIAAMQSSFESPATEGFGAAANSIAEVLSFSPAAAAVRAVPTRALVARGKPGASHYAETVAKAYRRAGGNTAAFSTAAAIPAEYLGVTFVYNADTDQYEASELAGAPGDGVRFLVYAVNPISGAIIEPVIEVGYADIVVTESANAASVRIELVSEGVTYLDYTVGVTGGTNSVTVSVTGFVSNGDDRVNFDLDTHLDLEATTITADYSLVVPTRGGFRLDFEGEMTSGSSQSTLEARGPHGTVTITGNHAATSGTFEVEVNGEPFATIEYTTGQAPVITGADGNALTEQELEALAAVFAVFIEGFDFVEDLVDPLG